MVSSYTLLAAAFASLALAAPAPAASSTIGSFTIHAMPNGNFAPHGPTAMYNAYLKYGKTPPAELVKTVMDYKSSIVSKRTSGSAVTTPQSQDAAWLTPVSIGTPPQVVNLDIDTGSSDLWVFSNATPAASAAGHSIYSPGKSTTAKLKAGYSWAISYVDGSSSSGNVWSDIVRIGGVSFPTQAVEAAANVSSQFSARTDLDGILGLGLSSLNQVKPTAQATLFDNLKSKLDLPVFTVNLNSGKPGTYNFGKIDSSLYTGSIAYTAVNPNPGYWTFTSTGFVVGTGSVNSTSITGIADTGSSLAILPEGVVSAYYAKVTNAVNYAPAGGWIFPCTATLPNFSFIVSGKAITIPGKYINFAPLDSYWCYGGIQGNGGVGLTIFGDVALKSAFVVFENSGTGKAPRIGWATKKLS